MNSQKSPHTSSFLSSLHKWYHNKISKVYLFTDGMPNMTMYDREWAAFSQGMAQLQDPVKASYAVELFLVLDYAIYKG